MSRFLFLWGPALAHMALIFWASSIPKLGRLPGDISDHTAHFAAYAVLGALVVRALAAGRWAGITRGRAALAWGLSVAYGATDELHQWFVPGRFSAVDDLVADALGAGAAVALIGATAAVIGRQRARRAV